MNKHLKCIAMR